MLLTGQLFAILPWLNNQEANQPAQEHWYSENYNQPRSVSPAESGASEFNIWQDSFAQYAMAVFAFAATGISVWAVWLLKNTLEATREAVRAADDAVTETRRIGEAQVRAYFREKGIVFRWNKRDNVSLPDIGFTPLISWENC
ncbi:MAG: hypothetical protein WA921_13130, partial [Ahrensia sp.]